MKQRLHFLMALVLALCLTAPALAAGFTDVPDSHWACVGTMVLAHGICLWLRKDCSIL